MAKKTTVSNETGQPEKIFNFSKTKVIVACVVAFFVLIIVLPSLQLATVNGDEEAVFIKKPWIFGSGGVEEVALVEGSEWLYSQLIISNLRILQ